MRIFFFLLLSSVTFFSCKKDDEASRIRTTLNQGELTLKPGDTAFVAININDSSFYADYSWSYKNSSILSFEDKLAHAVKFVAQEEGAAVIYINYPQKNRVDSCIIRVGRPNLIRVLAIGNSFSEDALEGQLYELFKARNRQVVIGNLMIGGASFTTHLENSLNNSASYSYRKINLLGEKSIYEKVSLAQAIADESWDFISFQQVSQESGRLETFTANLPMLHAYVKARNTYETTRYILHQTWAYAPSSNHPGFINYNRDQAQMYNAICDTYQSALKIIPANRVIPSGTAIQNARQTVLGNDLTRDGFHLSYDLGRFIVACTWYEGLSRVNVLNNPYKPEKLTEQEIAIAKQSAHFAVQRPFTISEIKY